MALERPRPPKKTTTVAPKIQILRSASFWRDFHDRKREKVARRGRGEDEKENEPPLLFEQRPIYTFVPYRATPLIGTVQTNGKIITTVPARPIAAPLAVGAKVHAPASIGLHTHRRQAVEIAARIRARMGPPPDPDAVLLARLKSRAKGAKRL
ncbi:hypothetical protein B0H15DRAFT_946853 [Mycena belliarum]|uniref:Uncharacterized protein n=1 Tax=Mycena belliarum TaxID=1033014 RepID=A0AAD6UE64_9AGAR|nr:hypothetical protein B0H15DRAFT_946853 [Mycena belliae]